MAAVEIHIFHCGQGDTVLLCLDAKKWMLVDCNLPGKLAVERFLGLLDGLGVERLDFILLSHPDRDHYSGMSEVLAHYSEAPRQVGTFCDSGFDVKLLPGDVRNDPALIKLYKRVTQLEADRRIRYQTLGAHHLTRTENPEWPAEVLVLSPVGSAVQLASLEALTGGIRQSANEYSIVLTVESGKPPEHFSGLLPGDAGAATLAVAFERLPVTSPAETGFDFVKIAHHGSWASHEGSPVAKAVRAPGNSVAVVSSRNTSDHLPRREVLRGYLDAGWCVFDTSRREEPEQGREFVDTLAWRESTGGHYDIKVTWTASRGICCEPGIARVHPKHLPFYPSRGVIAAEGRR
jgi:beta-lactamase superfamily II metal-dependent hydrolase